MIIDLLSAAIVCQFIDDQVKNMKSCSIAYGPTTEECDNMAIHSRISNTTFTSDSVVINLPVLSDSIGIEYCYIATASNGTFTAMVKGTFSTGIIVHSCMRSRPSPFSHFSHEKVRKGEGEPACR